METEEFDSSNTIYAALHILKKRGKVVGVNPIYPTEIHPSDTPG
jgi:hypothetical protein